MKTGVDSPGETTSNERRPVYCSIVIAVLDSHEIVRRQLLHWNQIIPAGVEVIVVDDGSETPIRCDTAIEFPFTLLQTHDPRPWTQDKARNLGAANARGEYLLMTDIDHILTREALDDVRHFRGDMLKFARQIAQLDAQGNVCHVGRPLEPHVNTFAMRKTVFERLGGYRETFGEYGTDREFREKYQRLVSDGFARPAELGRTIFVITEARWFHKLARVTTQP